jgi:hypothetical protein
VSEWQPIETAPKGVECLFYQLFIKGSNEWHWIGIDELFPDGACISTNAVPTHWMPLPEPPVKP